MRRAARTSPTIAMPYRHPLIVSQLKVFGTAVVAHRDGLRRPGLPQRLRLLLHLALLQAQAHPAAARPGRDIYRGRRALPARSTRTSPSWCSTRTSC